MDFTDQRRDHPATPAFDLLPRAGVRTLAPSLIRSLAQAASGREGVLPFWFGEPDESTPAAIVAACRQALAAGDTFYQPNLGKPALREALARYLGARHRPVSADRIAITGSGVSALMLAAQALLSPGDRVVAVTPLWPNLTEIPRILGAEVLRCPLVEDGDGHWRLDLERLFALAGPGTRALILNSPNNPTGWVLPVAEMGAILAHCRRHGIWILSDEAYGRLVFDGSAAAPSFLDIADADDRLWVANTFSKTWRMTGWRIGWLVAPAPAIPSLATLVEYNTSCVPGFVQEGARVALAMGDADIAGFVARLRERRTALVGALREVPRLRVAAADGAMYAFVGIEGENDSVGLAHRLLEQAGVGLAPGLAFGPEGEGHLRWCFARPVDELLEAARRVADLLSS
jgi:aspartate/methionine/tyrosine aminotransferase